MYKGAPKRLPEDFTPETLQPEVGGMTYSKCWKKTANQEYCHKIVLQNEGELRLPQINES